LTSPVKISLSVLIPALLIAACTKQPQDIETVSLTDDLYVPATDTVKPTFTVYRLDSFVTSGTNLSIIGGVTDPAFGRIESQSFCRFKFAEGNPVSENGANPQYDSIVLIMHSDSSSYGDTMTSWKVNVQELDEVFDPTLNLFYNTRAFKSKEVYLGSADVIFRPHVDDSVRIRLNDAFGSALFNLYKTKDPKISNQENFQVFFKGLRISGAPGNETVYRFNSNDSLLVMRLYFHEDKGVSVPKVLDFQSEGGTYQFNNMTCDVSATELDSLLPGNEILSENLNNRIYLNDLAGIGTEITFPSIPNLALLPDFVQLTHAEMHLRPIYNAAGPFPLIPYLALKVTTEENSTASYLYSADNTYVQNGGLNIDLLNPTNTGYTFDLSELLKTEVSSTPLTASTLTLLPLSSQATPVFSMRRLVAADSRNPSQPSLLVTHIVFYKK